MRQSLASALAAVAMMALELGLPMLGINSPIIGWLLLSTAGTLLLISAALLWWPSFVRNGPGSGGITLWFPPGFERTREKSIEQIFGIELKRSTFLYIFYAILAANAIIAGIAQFGDMILLGQLWIALMFILPIAAIMDRFFRWLFGISN